MSSITKKFITVGSMTVISRLLGVLRESALSHFLGACAEMDAFLIAFKFPSFFRKCFAEGGFQSLFIPYYIDFTSARKNNGAFIFSSRIFTILFWAMLFISVFIFIFADAFVTVMAPGFLKDPEKFRLTVNFTRIVFPNVAFVGLSTVYSGVMMSKNRFLPFALSPILVNIILIISIIIDSNAVSPGYRISIGVLISAIFQFFFFMACMKSMRMKIPVITKPRFSKKTKEFLKKLAPIIVGAGVAQINVFVDTFFGSFLKEGAISFIYFADRFIQLPLALFGISMATVILPEIASIFSSNDRNKAEVKEIQEKSIIFTLRMAIPSTVGLMAISYSIIDFLYGHGKFLADSVQQTSIILQIFAIGLPAYVLSKIFASVLFAQKDTRTPVTAAIISVISNIILNAVLIKPFGVNGLALGTSVAGFINAYIMYKKTREWFSFDRKIVICTAKIILSSVFMFIAVKATSVLITNNILFLIVGVSFGISIYFVSLIIMKDEFAVNMAKKVREKIRI